MGEEVSFTSLNLYGGLEFLTGNSPEELLKQLKQIRSNIRIISIYGSGSSHVAWFTSDSKINKVDKNKGKK